MRHHHTTALVVGGSLVGLSAAMFLAWQGVPTVLVEKHPGSSPHPRAIGYTARTRELFVAAGLGDRLPESPGRAPGRVVAESLAGPYGERRPWAAGRSAGGPEYSPGSGVGLAQDRLEPVLRDRARELGADLRLATTLTELEQDADEVRAVVVPRDGEPYTVHARYLVGADGHASGVRERLGITRTGPGHISTSDSVLFRSPLEEYLRDGLCQWQIEQPGFSAFVTTYADGRWLLLHHEEAPDPIALVHRATGRPDLPVEIVATGRWVVSALVADRFREGRVFLAGDAAHTLPPNRGAYGVNPGIEDAHNLAWKLAAVTSGAADPALLDTYEAERRPVALLYLRQLYTADGGTPDPATVLDDRAVRLGLLYRSAAVLGAGPELPPALLPDEWAGQPGTRAPHVRLRDGRSTLDLVQPDWVLLTDDDAWTCAGVRVEVLTAERIDLTAFRAAYGLRPGGATLVRPDGYIAWRSPTRPADPAADLAAALGAVAMSTTSADVAS